MTTPDTTRLAASRIRAWLDDDEDLRIPDTEWGRGLYDDLRAVLSLVEQLQGQLDKAAALGDAETLLSELEAAQARLDAATDLHWPTTIDGRLDLVCGNSSDHGAWRHWPCPDAEALGLGKESDDDE